MPNNRSAKKRLIQNEKKRDRNRFWRTTMRSMIKKVRAAVEGGNAEEAQKYLKIAITSIDRSQSKGILHKRAASRRISRLAKLVSTLKTS